MSAFNVKAHWDAEARVWWAESDDVPGLVAEAGSHDQLVADLHQIIPELLALNKPALEKAKISVCIISDQIEEVSYIQMPATFDREVLDILKDNGCYLIRTSGRHPIYYKPYQQYKLSSPDRHQKPSHRERNPEANRSCETFLTLTGYDRSGGLAVCVASTASVSASISSSRTSYPHRLAT